MAQNYWYEDRWMSAEEVRISPEDRGYYFGDGVYEVFRVYAGQLYEAEAHFARLEASAAGVRIPLPYPVDVLQERLQELVRRNPLADGTVYLQITRGKAPRNHLFPKQGEPVSMAFCQAVPRPLDAMRRGYRLVSVPDVRWLNCHFKTLNLLANVLAKQQAADQGADDAVLHRNGIVTECSASNIMIVSAGQLLTHPANHLILHGVTRGVVLRLAEQSGIPTLEREFSLEELLSAEEVFLTGTTLEVMPVTHVDDHPIGTGEPGRITNRLQQAFESTLPS
jgi:D-alanine transaminase